MIAHYMMYLAVESKVKGVAHFTELDWSSGRILSHPHAWDRKTPLSKQSPLQLLHCRRHTTLKSICGKPLGN